MHREAVKHKGVVAAGHRQTAKAAAVILEAGGNAFDAVITSYSIHYTKLYDDEIEVIGVLHAQAYLVTLL